MSAFRPPDPPLADDAIRLEPLHRGLEPEFGWVIADDDEIRRFTYVPSAPPPDFLATWLRRYEDGWQTGTKAGFAIRGIEDETLLGFAAFVQLDLEGGEGEIGYMVDAAARGRGAASRALQLLTGWGFDRLGLERIELRIARANEASTRVAERAGYRIDGVLRNVQFKEGLRSDTTVWSRLRTD